MATSGKPAQASIQDFRTWLEDELRAILGWRRGGSPVPLPTSCAWLQAVWLDVVRERRAKSSQDTSVRAIAERGDPSAPSQMSVGRAGDLLMIRSAFTDATVLHVGLSEAPPDETIQDLTLRGHARLSRLSFRALRATARLSRWSRAAEVRRLALAAATRSTGSSDDAGDDDEHDERDEYDDADNARGRAGHGTSVSDRPSDSTRATADARAVGSAS